MELCTNKHCPALHCTRQMIAKTSASGEERYEFKTFDEPEANESVALVDGKYVGFHCAGYIRGVIA